MPLAAGTADTPTVVPPYADTLGPNRAPPASATSDMPVIDLTKPNAIEEAEKVGAVDSQDKAANTGDTVDDKSAGEADGEPKQNAGEEGDKTSPQQRAAFARERNRRQAAERQTAELNAKVDQLTELVSKLVPKDQPQDDPRPTRDKFDDPDAYDRALEGWAGRRASQVALAEARAEQAKAAQESQLNGLRETYTQRVSEFQADHPDYEDVVMNDELQISVPMSQAILEAEDGPAIAYYLGNNPEVAERLAKLSPAQAVYEIGKISTRISNPPKPRAEPIRPLAARNPVGPKDPSEMSMDEYAAHRKSKAN